VLAVLGQGRLGWRPFGALAQSPRVLLLDEPLAGLSSEERDLVRALLDGLPRDLTILLIEHDMDVAWPLPSRSPCCITAR